MWRTYVDQIDSFWDCSAPGFYSFVVGYLLDQKDKSSNENTFGGHSVSIEFTSEDCDPVFVDFSSFSDDVPELKNCSFFVYVEERPSYRDYSHIYGYVCRLCFIAVPTQYVQYVQYAFSNGKDLLRASQSVPFYKGYFDVGIRSTCEPYLDNSKLESYNGTNLYTSSNLSNSDTGHPEIYDSPNGRDYTTYYSLFNDFSSGNLNFSADIVVSGDLLDITLHSSRPIITDIDGLLAVNAGILYDDGSDMMFAGTFYDYGTLMDSYDEWHFSFNLDDFAEYAYRKHCGIDNYYGFVSVMDESCSCIFSRERSLNLKLPGLFDDVEDPPDWKDYEPDPSEDPTPPHFDSQTIFNFNTSNSTYQSFSWTTINNYNVGGSGGGNTGSGDDSSSGSGDDSSSGTDDPGGDSSSGSDSGGGGSFNDWFSDAVVTINNNFNNGLDTLNENVRIIKENTENYFTAVHDYIEGYFHDWLEYIADLLKKFNDDFNAWTSAFGEFLTDSFKTINRNIAIVGDNIVKAIKNQVVPDKDVMIDIVNTHVPGFSDLQSGFNDFEPTDEDLVVSIPLFDQGGESSGVSNSDSSSADAGVFVFNFSEAFQDPIYGRIRTFGSVIIIGSTLISALNIFLKIFGLGSSSDGE